MIPMANVDILWAVTKSNLGCIFPTKNGIRPEKYLELRMIKSEFGCAIYRDIQSKLGFMSGNQEKIDFFAKSLQFLKYKK